MHIFSKSDGSFFLLIFKATEVEPPPPSPNVEIGSGHRLPSGSRTSAANGISPVHSVLPNAGVGQRPPSLARNWERQMEALRRMDEYIRTRTVSPGMFLMQIFHFGVLTFIAKMSF